MMRILMLLTVVALVLTMMAVSVSPAFARSYHSGYRSGNACFTSGGSNTRRNVNVNPDSR